MVSGSESHTGAEEYSNNHAKELEFFPPVYGTVDKVPHNNAKKSVNYKAGQRGSRDYQIKILQYPKELFSHFFLQKRPEKVFTLPANGFI